MSNHKLYEGLFFKVRNKGVVSDIVYVTNAPPEVFSTRYKESTTLKELEELLKIHGGYTMNKFTPIYELKYE